MKVRESGMPEEEMWNSFFYPSEIFKQLELSNEINNAVEFGSGYGTFTLEAASLVKGMVYAIDIETEMINILQKKIDQNKVKNVKILHRDFITHGTGLNNNSVDYVMLFNILHTEKPVELLKEAFRILKTDGKIGIIHWINSELTPRGPSIDIRPTPLQCINWFHEVNFKILKKEISLPPYHYGILGIK